MCYAVQHQLYTKAVHEDIILWRKLGYSTEQQQVFDMRWWLERQTQFQDITDQVSDQANKEASTSPDRTKPRAHLEYPISESGYEWFKTGAEKGCQNEKETDFLS